MKKELSLSALFFFSISAIAICQPVLIGELTGKEKIFTGFKNQLYFAAGSSIMVADITSKSIDLFVDLNEPVIHDKGASFTLNNFTRDMGTFLQFPVTESHIYFLTKPYKDSIRLWQSDGTPKGTKKIGVFDTIITYVEFKGALYFIAGKFNIGYELWKADPSGVISPITQLGLGKRPSYSTTFKSLIAGTSYLYCVFPDSLNNYRIYKSDGTQNGTTEIELRTSNENEIQELTFFKEKLYFLNNDTLWVYDHSGLTFMPDPDPERIYNFITKTSNHLFFSMSDLNLPYQLLYSTTGSFDDINLLFERDGYIRHLSIKDKLVICYKSDYAVSQLYVSDGTSKGTLEISKGFEEHEVPFLFSSAGDYLFFGQDYGTPEYPFGSRVYDLMQSDLTPSGTVRVSSLYKDTTYYSFPNNFTEVNNTLFFTTSKPANPETNYPELLYYYTPTSGQITSNKMAQHKNLSVYPNPTSGYCSVETDLQGSYKLINSFGIVVSEEDFNQKIMLDMNLLTSGIYLLQMVSDKNETIITKILKE